MALTGTFQCDIVNHINTRFFDKQTNHLPMIQHTVLPQNIFGLIKYIWANRYYFSIPII